MFLLLQERNFRRRARQMFEQQQYLWGTVTQILTASEEDPVSYVLSIRPTNQSVDHTFHSPEMFECPDPDVIGKQVRIYYLDDTFKFYHVDMTGLIPKE